MERTSTRVRALVLFVLSALILSACSRPEATYPERPNPGAPARDVQQAADGNAAFALDLYHELRQREGNLFFSPHGISTAMAITYIGARSHTAAEMRETLHFNLPDEQLHAAMGTLDYELHRAADAGGVDLRIANRLWGDSIHFDSAFLDAAAENYGSGFEPVDFRDEHVRRQIDEWIADHTQGRIPEGIEPQRFDRTRIVARGGLVTTSAAWFSGIWVHQFDMNATRRDSFHIMPESTVEAWLMHQEEEFRYYGNDLVQVLELPYTGDRLTMLLILPTERHGLEEVERRLTAEDLNAWIQDMHPQEVDVILPRFEARFRVELENVLTSMGMPTLFDEESADLSGLGDPLFTAAAVHEAYLEMFEEGTDAAVVVMTRGEMTSQPEPPEFRADHPFIFMIRDRETGAILFMGRVSDPTEGNRDA